MKVHPGRRPALRIIFVVMSLLLATTPLTFAFGDELADEAATEPASEAVAATGAPDAPAGGEQAADAVSADAAPAPSGESTSGSANQAGPYDSTTDGSPSGNGNGEGHATGRPCAGCVGNADDKNPPGQLPGPDEDGDHGYECDANSGVGKTNPAHSGCSAEVPTGTPDIDLEKDGPARAAVGEAITYTFRVTNTGDTTLTDVHVTDPLIGAGQITVTPATLAPDAVATATAEYTVRQADVADGKVPNVATAHGTPPSGPEVDAVDAHVVDVSTPTPPVRRRHTICHATGSASNPYVIIRPSVRGVFNGHFGQGHQDGRDIIPPFEYQGQTYSQNWPEGREIFDNGCRAPAAPRPAIGLEKSGPATSALGETITYTFKVTNDGDVPLTDVRVTDPLLGGQTIAVSPSTLQPEGEGTAEAQYTVAAGDVIDNEVHNTATARGTPPQGDDVSAVDSHVVEVPNVVDHPSPRIELDKDGPDQASVGETITYTFEVTNPGNVALTDVHVTDPLIGGGAIGVTPSTLAAGATGTATAQYEVAAADVIDNEVHNTATAHGTPPVGDDVTAVDSHDVEVPIIVIAPTPKIELDKDGPRSARVGDEITYTFAVKNSGDLTLTNVRIDDPLVSDSTLAVSPSTLAVGASGTATATYTVTRADGKAGEILNTARAKGTPPSGPDVEDRDDHTVKVPTTLEAPRPGVRLDKSGPGTAREGDTITYRFRATNTGDTTLADVHITDEKLGIQNLPVTPSTLGPGESGTASATYRVTPADARAGVVHNTAIVTGTPPGSTPITDRDDHTTRVPSGPGTRRQPPAAPPGGDLPATGSDAPQQLMLAAMALLLGYAMLAAGRRRTVRTDSWSVALPQRPLAGHQSPRPVHRRTGGPSVG